MGEIQTALKSACAEKRLLVHCAHARLRREDASAIGEIAGQNLDWDYILSEAAENSIVPLVNKGVREAASGRISGGILDRLKEAGRANTVRSLYLSGELGRILSLFRAEGIQAIPYKGPVLACMAYGDVTLREFEDLDIIVRQRDLAPADAILKREGYTPRFPWILSRGAASALVPGEYNYRDKTRRIMVELHTEKTLRHFPVTPDLDDLFAGTQPVAVAGQDISTFSAEDTLVLLCLHGSKDFWERLSWVADISEMLLSHPGLDWGAICRRAEEYRSTRILHLGLRLAGELLGTETPPEVRARVEADAEACEVAQIVAGRLLRRNFPGLNSWERFQFRRRLVPGFVSGVRYSSRLTLVPTEDDWEMLPLPGFLSPLYLLLRPLRLLRKYGVRRDAAAGTPPPAGPAGE